MIIPPDTLVDERYVVESVLGKGGMGHVYRARDKWLKRPVALKVIDPLRGGADPTERLREEAAALASLRSDNVVQVYAFGLHKEACYFAMEFVNGPTLEAVIQAYRERHLTVPIFRAVTVLTSVASGLAKVHGAGVVHRDVKPANIVIEDDTGRPVLIDFGLAGVMDRGEGGRSAFGGTPSYMAPEQCLGQDSVTPQTDVYALGCTAFELLTGRLPFTAPSVPEVLVAHCSKAPPVLSSLRPDLVAFDDVIARALAKDPADRFGSMLELAGAFEEARADWRRTAAPSASVSLAEPEEPRPDSDTTPTGGRPVNVLVVDDDDAFRKFAGRAAQLGMFGAHVTIRLASSGASALASAERDMPDLVLLDFDMPKLNGVETLSRLRALPDGGRARVVVISARAGEQEQWQFSVLGVRDFLAKPVHLESLVKKIADIAERSGWTGASEPTKSV